MTSFREFIKTTFDRYKRKSKGDFLVCLPVYDNDSELVAFLRPIGQDFRQTDPGLAALLTKWRVENPTISTGKFEVSEQRTAAWLDNLVIGRDDRLLFMIEGLDHTPIGHIGFSNFDFVEQSGEVDSVLRGLKDGYPGIMAFASNTLIDWGYKELRLKKVTLSVFSDNDSAIRFYERLGFKKTHSKGLYKVFIEEKNEEKLEIAPEGYSGPIEKYYIYMMHEGAKA